MAIYTAFKYTPLKVSKSFIPSYNANYPPALLNETGDLWITVHETGNTRVGADAYMHAVFLWQGGGPDNVAFHFAVDRDDAWQMLKLNRIGWHASDGCDDRNRDLGCYASIAIETCVDSNNIYKVETRRNLATLIAMICNGDPAIDFGGIDPKRFSPDRITTHQRWAYDKKECPTYMLRDGYMPILTADVKTKLGIGSVTIPVVTPTYPAPQPIVALDSLARSTSYSTDTVPAMVPFSVNSINYLAIWVGDRVKSIRITPRQRYLEGQADRVGPDLGAGVTFDVDWLILKPSDPAFTAKYRTPWGTAINVKDTVRAAEKKTG